MREKRKRKGREGRKEKRILILRERVKEIDFQKNFICARNHELVIYLNNDCWYVIMQHIIIIINYCYNFCNFFNLKFLDNVHQRRLEAVLRNIFPLHNILKLGYFNITLQMK